jgi:cob(I)alamin adenosyltransferase
MPLTLDERIKGRKGFGLIQLFTGHGKGKTTAAIGEALRAHAIGKKVGIVFFDKGGETHYCERKILDQLGIHFVSTGRDRIDPVTGRFDFSIQEVDKTEATRGLEEAKRLFAAKYDLVALDEINSTTSLGMLDENTALQLIDSKPDQTELILTGRDAPQSFIKKAHLVTDMRLLKHYFYSGVPAREGLDF